MLFFTFLEPLIDTYGLAHSHPVMFGTIAQNVKELLQGDQPGVDIGEHQGAMPVPPAKFNQSGRDTRTSWFARAG
ncbi:hypothetical protein ACWDKQ_13805 [Saccharopolyspora sp. NPDC000995]